MAARNRPEQNLEEKQVRNAVGDIAGRRPHGDGRPQYTACGTRPHAARDVRGMAAPCMAQPAHVAPSHRATWDTASRGPTTIVTPKSQFRTFPLDHGKTPKKSPHDPLGITDSALKNQLVVVSVQYGLFNTYIPIRSMTIGKSRVARDPIAMHTSWRSNSDIASVTRKTHLPKTHPVLWPEICHTIFSSDRIGYPRVKASGESSTTKHRILHASGPHPIPPPNDPNTTKTSDLSTRQMVSRTAYGKSNRLWESNSLREVEQLTRSRTDYGRLSDLDGSNQLRSVNQLRTVNQLSTMKQLEG
ncbi:hypothetical protein F511_38951 [Dorcoceras hygrometricum]|uniref:Uncharacterized protein n=1 Tax=Dorcoceras hygrometricum TaxID=472368 RepID=A0A2Z7DER6_9LAMI|nr:hypothetical protein F511_38951 [Dorcoceras hygrometricum]